MTQDFQKIADSIRNRIDEYAQKIYDDGHRTHLGASIIGDKCKRKLWFTFRWVYHHKHSGRMQRLFNTGHKEEIRIIEWLQGAGYNVRFGDPETGEQFKISDCETHFGGSLDGIITILELGECLLECKTNKTGAEFKVLIEKGIELMKPKHWAQVCTYGFKLNIKHVVYINKNKDNDDLCIFVKELDFNHAQEQILKAQEIISATQFPSRIAETPAYFECKYCDFVDICHRNKPAEKNCRSCKYAFPSLGGQWVCNKWETPIPKDSITSGCEAWESILL